MANRNRYRGGRKRKSRGGRWLLLAFCILCAVVLRYGQSEPLIGLRRQTAAWLSRLTFYEQAITEVGKFFSGDSEAGATSVFGQLFFGTFDPEAKAE